ncbi:unnamed protein product [Adineta steineri]|uniref:Uncharacterized protein n=1 Tax=Adineta steineri TaxID=433720 RepID=A0A814UWS7_9BILA|nr:unnamed protein product [Adineta steineri]CAF1416424.1 unnamed protein product [Adineta steineri]
MLVSTFHCILLTNFFSYGPSAIDYTVPPVHDDFVGPVWLPYIFSFFNNNRQKLFLGVNGLFSYIAGVSQYVPS